MILYNQTKITDLKHTINASP